MVYKDPSNVLNYLTVGDDFGDICLLDRLSHFSYICDTDVLCMFVSKANLAALLSEQYRDELFLSRRAKLRLNQLVGIKSRILQVKKSIAKNVILEFNKLEEGPKEYSSRVEVRNKFQKDQNLQKAKPILGKKTSQVYPMNGPKRSIERKIEKSDEESRLSKIEKHLSGVKENERSRDMLLDPSDSLNPAIERKEDRLTRKQGGDPPLAFGDQPQQEAQSKPKEPSTQQADQAEEDPQKNPHSNLAAFIRAKMGNIVVAGAAIKELQSANAAISGGFSSKLIRASSFDRDAQSAKTEKKEILAKVVRRAEASNSMTATTEFLQAPFLEDLEADSKAITGLDKVRDFVKKTSTLPHNDVSNKMKETTKTLNPKARVEDAEKARKKNRLVFLARLHKAELDGSLIEDSDDNFNTRVRPHNRRTWWRPTWRETTTGTSHPKKTPRTSIRSISTLGASTVMTSKTPSPPSAGRTCRSAA